LGNPAMILSLGRIGLFKGNMITLCVRVINVPMISHGTSTEEEFEVIKFVENNAPFPLLLGKTWIKKDWIRRKAKEEATKKKNKELRDLIARRIDQLVEEREVESKQQNEREVDINFEREQEGLKDLSMQEESMSTQDLVRKEVLPLNSLKEYHQCKVTMLRKDKNKNGKKNPETQITGNKARNFSKKKSKLEKIQEVLENISQEADLQNLNLVGIT
jgi:hypothetical protein